EVKGKPPMHQPKTRRLAPPLLVCLVLGFLLVAGCKKSKSGGDTGGPNPGGPNAGTQEPTGPHAAGKKVFQNNCARCHSDGSGGGGMMGGPMAGGPPRRGGQDGGGGPPMRGGPGGPGDGGMGGRRGFGGRGPDLSKIAADPKHTREWV